MWWLNISAFIVATIATGYLFFVVSKTAKELKKGFLFLTIGILISLNIHSFAEFLESIGAINIELLVKVMPALVLIGAIFILIGCIKIYDVSCSVSRRSGGGAFLKNEKRNKTTASILT